LKKVLVEDADDPTAKVGGIGNIVASIFAIGGIKKIKKLTTIINHEEQMDKQLQKIFKKTPSVE
jgi:hypothetical protein